MNGPAIIDYDNDGSIDFKLYFIKDKYLTEQE
jgi:hypothetical protein